VLLESFPPRRKRGIQKAVRKFNTVFFSSKTTPGLQLAAITTGVTNNHTQPEAI